MTKMTAQQEMNSANARATSREFGQSRDNPFLINIDDGRLIPNVKRIREHRGAKYRVYTGDPKASIDERMAYLKSGLGRPGRRGVVNSAAVVEEPFDIAKASKEDLVAFAASEYGLALDSAKSLKVLREEFAKAAEALDMS
jgi:hypothetical protein